MPSSNKQWSLGAKALLKQLSGEFEALLQDQTEKFLDLEERDTVTEEDIKIALVDLHKRMAAEEISLPSSRFTIKELLNGIKVIQKYKPESP